MTMAGIRGFSFSKSVPCMVADGSDLLPTALDGGNYARRLAFAPAGVVDALFSGVERFFANASGYADQDVPAGIPNEIHHPWR